MQFLPFLMMLTGRVTDANLLFYKECSKLLMMLGALMILFALTKGECKAASHDLLFLAERRIGDDDVPLLRLVLEKVLPP